MSKKRTEIWAVEVTYTPIVDRRRRLKMRSKAMSLSEAQQQVVEYTRMGWDAAIVDGRGEQPRAA